MTKLCNKCGQTKDLETGFYVGRYGPCKACVLDSNKLWQRQNKEKAAVIQERYQAKKRQQFQPGPDTQTCTVCAVSMPLTAEFFPRAKGPRKASEFSAKCKQCWSTERALRSERRVLRVAQAQASDKVCSQCSKRKPVADFPEVWVGSKWRRGVCKKCRAHRANHSAAGWSSKHRRRVRQAAVKYVVSDRDLRRLRQRFGGSCAYCDAPANTVDHVLPIARGGRHAIGNLLPACKSCNSQKHVRLLAEWRLQGRRPEPNAVPIE